MVLKKSIYYGRFDGFQAPLVPKAPRSLRRISSKGNKICAFELLAAVASKLLQESKSSTSSTGPERKEQISIPKEFVHLEPANLKLKLESPLKELPQSDNDSCLEHVSTVTTSDFLKKVGTDVKFEASEGKKLGTSHGDLCDFNLVNNKAEELTFRDPVGSCVNTGVLNKSCSNVNLPFYRGNVKTGIRDDDKKSLMRAFRSQSRAGYRRVRKMLTSRYRKVAPKKEFELTNSTSGGAKPFYHNRKDVYMQERHQTDVASKRRKLFNHSSNTAYIREASKDSHVKFSIKSFKVPELYLELPETVTVGSLKRTVMEAVTAILGGEIRVGILLEGKKVGDNNITLEQTGISQNCNLETLGFTLEPSFPHDCPSLIQNESTIVPPCDINQQLCRSGSNPITDVGFSTSLDTHVDKNQEIIPFQIEASAEERAADSKTLVPVTAVKAEALSMVPVSHKPNKKYELSQRRIRRTFSVSEVEALVEAVETLGTGRWRDVKLRAFDDANHRTYVDLKDKWKTLVHTASISPQQRRGEPVPQDLLDRVLVAHAHWSETQLKQHRKTFSTKLLGI